MHHHHQRHQQHQNSFWNNGTIAKALGVFHWLSPFLLSRIFTLCSFTYSSLLLVLVFLSLRACNHGRCIHYIRYDCLPVKSLLLLGFFCQLCWPFNSSLHTLYFLASRIFCNWGANVEERTVALHKIYQSAILQKVNIKFQHCLLATPGLVY